MPQITIQQAFELALQHTRAGQLSDAEKLCRQILAQQPRHHDAIHLLGVIAFQVGRHQTAVSLYRNAIALYFNFPEAHLNMGNALAALGRRREAMDAYRQAIALRPNYCDAYNNLAVALHDSGRLDEAIDACRQVTALLPGHAQAHSNLGNALMSKGHLEAAIAAYRQAIAINPGLPESHSNLGSALQQIGRLDEAIAACRQALALRPGFPEACSNLGQALRASGQFNQAIDALREAIALRPQAGSFHSNLANALGDSGQHEQATLAYREAIRLEPANAQYHSNLIFTLYFHPGCDDCSITEEQRRWDQQHSAAFQREMRSFANDPSANRRLKVGYVSPDFRSQAEAFFVVPLLAAHDHKQLEVHCYASVARPDAITERLKGYADVWHDVLGESDEQLANRIRADRIDILIDLTMHMANNRLLTFARKPAPVQVAWLAYPGSTGLSTMDYRLTDAFMDPPGTANEPVVEKPVRLPGCWCCYDPLSEPLAVSPSPAAALGRITFGSLNNFRKINPLVLSLWAQVLREVAGSHLLLLAPEGDHRRQTTEFLEAQGIGSNRLEFQTPCLRPQYLRTYDRIDIALDPFPYNGITTTCDALWMGVPVITLAGQSAASRAGLSLLNTAGLGELVGRTAEEFVQLSARLAGDLSSLQQLRSNIRHRMEQSPLMDRSRFARNVETAYRSMWQAWCKGVSPTLSA